MKKFLQTLLFAAVLVSVPAVGAEAALKASKEQELCHFAEDVFQGLSEVGAQGRMAQYDRSSDPVIQGLAHKFTASWKKGATSDELQTAVSELGRLFKCSADVEYQMPYSLHKKDLQDLTTSMEVALHHVLPKNPNYHKLMIESLADEQWNVAFYAYLKIAEGRCLD